MVGRWPQRGWGGWHCKRVNSGRTLLTKGYFSILCCDLARRRG
jgi:hypothetical protein